MTKWWPLCLLALPSFVQNERVVTIQKPLVIRFSSEHPARLARSIVDQISFGGVAFAWLDKKSLPETSSIHIDLNQTLAPPSNLPIREQLWSKRMNLAGDTLSSASTDFAQAKQELLVSTQSPPSSPPRSLNPARLSQNLQRRVEPPRTDQEIVQSIRESMGEEPVVESQTLVSGKIELDPDEPLGPGRTIRVVNSSGVEGKVDLRRGTFVAPVAHSGDSVRVEMTDEAGMVVASGEASDHRAKLIPNSFAVQVRNALNRNLSASTRDVYQTKFLDDVYRSDQGEEARYAHVDQRSIINVQTEGEKFYPVLQTVSLLSSVASNGSRQKSEPEVALFKRDAAQAFITATRDARAISATEQNDSLVWGLVRMNGKPAMGVKVVFDQDERQSPVYLAGGIIPDAHQTATGPDGRFTFVDVSPGPHSVKAFLNQQFVGYANFEIRDKTVTPVTIDLTTSFHEVSVNVYDAFAGDALGGEVNLQALENSISIFGEEKIHLADVSRMSRLSCFPQNENYLPSQYVFIESEAKIDLPLVSRKWLDTARSVDRVSDAPATGTIVVFTGDKTYDLQIDKENSFAAQISYFDEHGDKTLDQTLGGGFILWNIDQGFAKIRLRDERTKLLYSPQVPVDTGGLTVLKY